MKTRYLLLSLLVVSTVVFAGYYRPWDNANPPTLSLPAAYSCALIALGDATNQMHCISARVSTEITTAGGWEFAFYSTNNPPKAKFVYVAFDTKTHIQDLQGSFR